MNRILLLCASVALLTFLGCQPAAKEPATVQVPGTLSEMVIVRHPVADFPAWLTVFDAHDSTRVASGLKAISLGRSLDDSSMVNIVMVIDDMDKAKAFTESTDLKETMERAGVTGPPSIMWIKIIRDDTASIETPDRVTIAHKVKDVGAWLAVYDADKSNREANGFVDRALARDAVDSNMVYVHLAITDMEKARAYAASEGLKEAMVTAGVEGEPSAFWYRKVR